MDYFLILIQILTKKQWFGVATAATFK
jgi:hypothetical protein